MILVDSKRDMIQAIVPPFLVSKFKEHLVVGCSYIIFNHCLIFVDEVVALYIRICFQVGAKKQNIPKKQNVPVASRFGEEFLIIESDKIWDVFYARWSTEGNVCCLVEAFEN
ncbi:unnamed protein product [Vicia faba]|uniref:Uncharacterized protein n=1 Tax=Vicia faba TaxID=3906 RepID=A0AAV0ZVS9_VICFA|nr:unnamed protein product [Vicia faba]